MTSKYIIKYVIKYEKYVMISKNVWKVCHDIKKVWNNVKMHVITLKIMSWRQKVHHDVKKYVKYVTMFKDMSWHQ